VLGEVASIVKPETILDWHRRLVAKNFDGSKNRTYPGRPKIDAKVEDLIIRLAKENRSWGYDRLVGALGSLSYKVSDQSVGNVLKRHGIPPAPEHEKTTTWREFMRSHMDVLAATDFFTAEIWAKGGLVTYYVLFFMHVATRRVHVVGITPCPHEEWMTQMARNVTMADDGFLWSQRYFIHDRDGKFCPAFVDTVESGGVKTVKLPARSPNLNCFAERWVRSIKDECLSKLILFGEASLRRALAQFGSHFHEERPHQGKGNVILFPSSEANHVDGPIHCRERLGGLLKCYHREAG
jgi:putative transposase